MVYLSLSFCVSRSIAACLLMSGAWASLSDRYLGRWGVELMRHVALSLSLLTRRDCHVAAISSRTHPQDSFKTKHASHE